MLTDELVVAGMIRFNVKAFMTKDIRPQEILRIIKLVAAGGEYYPPCFFLHKKQLP